MIRKPHNTLRTSYQASYLHVISVLCFICYFTLPNFAYAQTITDMSGEQVSLPKGERHITDLWHAHNEITVMLGGSKDIDVSAENPHDSPLLFKIAPHLRAVRYGVKSNAVSKEYLLSRHINLAFTATNLQAEALRSVGIATLACFYTNFDDMLRSIDMTAHALNTPYAEDKARTYRQNMTQLRTLLAQRLSSLPSSQRPKVLHISHISPLIIDGKQTLIDSWITTSGGQNAADVLGNHRPVSAEQILDWNPDIIILEADAGTLAANSPLMMSKAGQTHKIWRNPRGIFLWDRYGCESFLQLIWSAKHFHPQIFADLDMNQNMLQFYQQFFSFTPSQVLRNQILNGTLPHEYTP